MSDHQPGFGMTLQMRRAFDFIRERIDSVGVAPTTQEIADHLGLRSKSGANRILNGLEERGCIRRLPHRARAIEIVRPRDDDELRRVLRREMPTIETLSPRIAGLLEPLL